MAKETRNETMSKSREGNLSPAKKNLFAKATRTNIEATMKEKEYVSG